MAMGFALRDGGGAVASAQAAPLASGPAMRWAPGTGVRLAGKVRRAFRPTPDVVSNDNLALVLVADAGLATHGGVAFEARDSGACPDAVRAWIKRAFDIVFSAAVLLAFLPVLASVAWLISREGGGVLYVDRRPGRDGRVFGCLKFRTMYPDAADRLQVLLDADPALREEFDRTAKLRLDPRVTRVGAFLRRTSLDELPQFWNCLVGDMSVVGPRPRTLRELEWAPRYGLAFREAFQVRPGVTGPWQVSGRSDVTYGERVAMDAAYARGWTLPGDLRIVLRTLPSVLRQQGAA